MAVGAQAFPSAQGTLPDVPFRVRNGLSERVQETRLLDFQT